MRVVADVVLVDDHLVEDGLKITGALLLAVLPVHVHRLGAAVSAPQPATSSDVVGREIDLREPVREEASTGTSSTTTRP